MKLVCAVLVLAFWALPAAGQGGDVTPPTPPADTGQASPSPPPQSTEKPPPRTHTGWATLLKDSVGDFVTFPQRESTWWLIGMGGAAALATHPADDYVQSHIVGNHKAEHFFVAGKWIGSAPVEIGTAVGLWAVGRYVIPPAADGSRTNKYSEIGFDFIRVEILSQTLVHSIKYTVRRDRPTGECCSFPSGHAATAFAMASVLERHLGYRASWPALVGATYVATSRLVDNRHFLSDVAFGAGIGLASGWTVVGDRARGRPQFSVTPVPVDGGMMIAVTRLPTGS